MHPAPQNANLGPVAEDLGSVAVKDPRRYTGDTPDVSRDPDQLTGEK